MHAFWGLGDSRVALPFGGALATNPVGLKGWLLTVECQGRQYSRLMGVVMIHDIVKCAVQDRTEMPITLVNHGSGAINILETVYAKTIIRISDERPVLPRSFNVVTRRSFVVVVLGAWPHWRRNVTTTKQRDQRSVHIVPFCFTRPLNVNTVEVNSYLLVFDGSVVQMVRQVVERRIWMQREFVVDLDWDDDIAVEAKILRQRLVGAKHAPEWTHLPFLWQAIPTRIVISKWAIWSEHPTLATMLVMVWNSVAFDDAEG